MSANKKVLLIASKRPGEGGGEEQKVAAFVDFFQNRGYDLTVRYNLASQYRLFRVASAILFLFSVKVRAGYFYFDTSLMGYAHGNITLSEHAKVDVEV